MKKKGIGLDVKPPGRICKDNKCPFHGSTSVRGQTFTGVVVADKMSRTVSVAWTRRMYVSKYERYEKKRSKLPAHNPECINAKKGDLVLIAETRPLSKTKHFAVVKVVGKESKKDLLKEESLEEAKVPEKKKDKSKEAVEPVTKQDKKQDDKQDEKQEKKQIRTKKNESH